jgi:Ca2+-binding RTX toxin-like protein
MAIINGTNGNDRLIGTVLPDAINGLAGNDTILGLAGDDVLSGGFGNNVLDGGLGNDTASYAGFGNNVVASLETGIATFFGGSDRFINIENLIGSNSDDILTGNSFNNTIRGGAGFDVISGGAGDDRLFGDEGSDRLNGDAGNDILRGGDGIDTLNGGDGNDLLEGNRGNDTMIGGLGNDTFGWFDGDGSDLIQGDGGTDTVFFQGSVAQGDTLTLTTTGTDILLQRTNLVPVTLRMQSIENFNSINGLGGNDSLRISNISIGSGVSFIGFNGGEGNDTLVSTNVSVDILATGDNGNDVLAGGSGNDQLTGGQGNDVLNGGSGNDRLVGAGGLNNGRGEIDILIGGAGRDTFVIGSAYDDGNNLADGEAGNFFNGIDGTGDFARILDFRINEDVIQLSGPRSSYVLKALPNSLQGGSSIRDVGIFRKNGPTLFQPDELVAIVQDAPGGLNLANTAQFRFA